jgi:hypothetical protein
VTRPEERTNIGPDHKVIDMKALYAALVQALTDVHLLGQRTRKLLPSRAD